MVFAGYPAATVETSPRTCDFPQAVQMHMLTTLQFDAQCLQIGLFGGQSLHASSKLSSTDSPVTIQPQKDQCFPTMFAVRSKFHLQKIKMVSEEEFFCSKGKRPILEV